MRQPFSTGEAIALGSPTAGRMSKRARKSAMQRLAVALDLHEALQPVLPQQPTEREALLQQAARLRGLADRGMCPRKYKREAERLEAQAATL